MNGSAVSRLIAAVLVALLTLPLLATAAIPPITEELVLSQIPRQPDGYPLVAAGLNRFIVVWKGDPIGIRWQTFDRDGTPLGTQQSFAENVLSVSVAASPSRFGLAVHTHSPGPRLLILHPDGSPDGAPTELGPGSGAVAISEDGYGYRVFWNRDEKLVTRSYAETGQALGEETEFLLPMGSVSRQRAATSLAVVRASHDVWLVNAIGPGPCHITCIAAFESSVMALSLTSQEQTLLDQIVTVGEPLRLQLVAGGLLVTNPDSRAAYGLVGDELVELWWKQDGQTECSASAASAAGTILFLRRRCSWDSGAVLLSELDPATGELADEQIVATGAIGDVHFVPMRGRLGLVYNRPAGASELVYRWIDTSLRRRGTARP